VPSIKPIGYNYFMKVTLICGLLGAGKTSFIINFLKEVDEKCVVLVNDFGRLDIDGEILSSGGLETVTLQSGCVCCSLKTDMMEAIDKAVSELSPQHLVIEPSGIAAPSGVLEALGPIHYDELAVVGIVDASEFAELYELDVYGRFFTEQVSISDIIIANKTDLAGAEKTAAAVSIIRRLNPAAQVLEAVNAEVNLENLFISHVHRDIKATKSHLEFRTYSFRPRGQLSLGFVERLFEDMSEGRFGQVVRAKALLSTDKGPYRYDLSFSSLRGSKFEKEITENLLVVIGNGLAYEDLSELLSGDLALKNNP
jgi:G3E family GTPase